MKNQKKKASSCAKLEVQLHLEPCARAGHLFPRAHGFLHDVLAVELGLLLLVLLLLFLNLLLLLVGDLLRVLLQRPLGLWRSPRPRGRP